MIPLTCAARELEHIIPQVRAEVQKTFDFHGATCPLRIGTMIEIPRACLTAESIAPLVDFMSFGTNGASWFLKSVAWCVGWVWGGR